MTTWIAYYWPGLKCDLDDPDAGRESPCFRVAPENEPELWIAQTNSRLPPEVQEEAALIMAQALSNALG